MKKSSKALPDPLIDAIRRTRERLVKEHGGIRGWGKYLQEQQRKHPPTKRVRSSPAR
jgi:hypothetical protein